MKQIITLAVGIMLCWMTLLGKDQTMEFIVLGDTHYFHYKQGTDMSLPDKAPMALRAMGEDMKRKNIVPDLICQVGDVIENQLAGAPLSDDEGARQWEAALKDFKRVFPDIPFLICPGNHDWYGNRSWFGGKKNLMKYLVPFLEHEMASSLQGRLFYSFRFRDSLFLFINHVGMDSAMDIEQRKWLLKNLIMAEENSAIRHVFAFGHCGLWNVNYIRFNENAELLPLLTGYPKLKAYFHGHIHSNNLSVRQSPGRPGILQAVVAGLTPSFTGIDQQASFLTLNPPPSRRSFLALPESCISYCRVTVQGDSVRLRYEKVGGGTLTDITYSDPGSITDNLPKAASRSPKYQPDAKEARLHLFPFFPERIFGVREKPAVMVNGKKVGELRRMDCGWEVNHLRVTIDLPPELVRERNTITITNPNQEHFLIRDCRLEIRGGDSSPISTPLYPKVICTGNHKNIYMNFGLLHPEYGTLHSSIEKNIPDEMIQNVPLNKPFSFNLNFN